MPSNFPTATTEASSSQDHAPSITAVTSGQSQRPPHEQALLWRIGERIADEVEKVAHGRQTDCEQAASDVLALSGHAELLGALKECAEALDCERSRHAMHLGREPEDIGARSALKAADAAIFKAEGAV